MQYYNPNEIPGNITKAAAGLNLKPAESDLLEIFFPALANEVQSKAEKAKLTIQFRREEIFIFAANLNPQTIMEAIKRLKILNISILSTNDDGIEINGKECSFKANKCAFPYGIVISRIPKRSELAPPAPSQTAEVNINELYRLHDALNRLGIESKVHTTHPPNEILLSSPESLDKLLTILAKEQKYLRIPSILKETGIDFEHVNIKSKNYLMSDRTGYALRFINHDSCKKLLELLEATKLGFEAHPLHVLLSPLKHARSEATCYELFRPFFEKLLGIKIEIDYPPQYKDGIWFKLKEVLPTEKKQELLKILIRYGLDLKAEEIPMVSHFAKGYLR